MRRKMLPVGRGTLRLARWAGLKDAVGEVIP